MTTPIALLGSRMIVTGRVQGVGFRAFTRRVADEEKVRGWVRNLPDGSVEVQAWGTAEQLDSLRVQIRRGPRFSVVQGLAVEPIPGEPPASGFEIRYG